MELQINFRNGFPPFSITKDSKFFLEVNNFYSTYTRIQVHPLYLDPNFDYTNRIFGNVEEFIYGPYMVHDEDVPNARSIFRSFLGDIRPTPVVGATLEITNIRDKTEPLTISFGSTSGTTNISTFEKHPKCSIIRIKCDVKNCDE